MSTYLTTQEVADRLGVSVFTIRRYVRNGKLKAVKLDGVLRISRDDLAAFLKAREVGFVPAPPADPAVGPAPGDPLPGDSLHGAAALPVPLATDSVPQFSTTTRR